MKLPSFISPKAISTELVAVIIAALIFAYLQRNSPTLRDWLAKDPAFRDDLSARARKRSADFSWSRAAAETAAREAVVEQHSQRK